MTNTVTLGPGKHAADYEITSNGEVFNSLDGYVQTTITGTYPIASDPHQYNVYTNPAPVSVMASNVTIGGAGHGFTIDSDDSWGAIQIGEDGAQQSSVSNVVVQGNVVIAAANNFIQPMLLAVGPDASNVTIGGLGAGQGNIFNGGSQGGTIEIGGGTVSPINVNLIDNTFMNVTVLDDAAGGTISGNHFNDGPPLWVKPGIGTTISITGDNTFSGDAFAHIFTNVGFYSTEGSGITASVDSRGVETDTVNGYSSTLTFGLNMTVPDPFGNPWGVTVTPIVVQENPDQVNVYLTDDGLVIADGPVNLDMGEIVLKNAAGVSATSVVTALNTVAVHYTSAEMVGVKMDAPLHAANGTFVTSAGPGQSIDLTAFYESLVSGATVAWHSIVGISAVSGAPGSASLNGSSLAFTTGPGYGLSTFTYTMTDAYGETATGKITVADDPGPTAHDVAFTVGHSQSNVHLTNQILSAVTPGLPGDTETIRSVGTAWTSGDVSLNAGQVIYTPPASNPLDLFSYTVSNEFGETSTAIVGVTIDPGPTAHTVAATVPTAGFTADSLTSAILGGVTAGMAGDKLTITNVGSAEVGTVSLVGGNVSYDPTAATPAAEMALLNQFAEYGKASDSFGYTVADQYGDKATGTINLNLQPMMLTGPITTGATILASEPTQEIVAPGVNATVDLGLIEPTNDVVFANAPGAAIYTGFSNAVVELSGGGNLVEGGNGWVDVTGAAGTSTVNLGNGNDNLLFVGGGNHVRLGNGDDQLWLGGSGSSALLGAGTDTVSMMGRGATSDTFQLDDSHATMNLLGTSNMVFIQGGNDLINDAASRLDALTLNIGAAGGNVTVNNFATSLGVIDIAHQLIDNGLLGAAPNAGEVAGYLNTHGGGMLFADNAGFLQFGAGTAGHLTASNFHIT